MRRLLAWVGARTLPVIGFAVLAMAGAATVVLVFGNRHERDIALSWPAMVTAALVLAVLACAGLPARACVGADMRRLARREAQSTRTTISHVRLVDGSLPRAATAPRLAG
jgi:hypothetical protein